MVGAGRAIGKQFLWGPLVDHAMNTPGYSSPPSRWRPQFSLRVALLLFTAFAVGFPLWYRWPHEETEYWTLPGAQPPVMQITTWQRQWGGGRLKHGLQRALAGGEVFDSVMYKQGKKHGPAMRMNPDGKLEVVGHYLEDMKEGTWVAWDSGPKRTSTWLHDKLEGPYEIEMADGRQFHLLFAGGRLTHFNGHPAHNRLFDLREAGSLDERLARELTLPTTLEMVEVPLRDCMMYLQELHHMPITIDLAHITQADLPVTIDIKNIDLCSALTLITAPHDLASDYRYGMICVTTAKDSENWHDPTGVAEIKPPKETALARAWNTSASLEAVNSPLAPALDYLGKVLAINIDTTKLSSETDRSNAYPITVNAKGLPFRHILGLALYQAHCRCQLDGDKLVILPAESK